MSKQRRTDARSAAEKYAPAPQGSSLLYGLIAIVLLVMSVWIISRFYGFSFLEHPIFLVAGGGIAFCGGFILRRVRRHRHDAAYVKEFNKRSIP
jgi:hypothetical protein